MDFGFFINVIASCKKFIVILMVLQILGRYWLAFFCAAIKTNNIKDKNKIVVFNLHYYKGYTPSLFKFFLKIR